MIRCAAAATLALVLGASPLEAQVTVFTVTTARASVHAGPSTGSPVVGTTERGTTFEVTREIGSWVRVAWPAMPGGGGYVHVTWGTLARGTASAPAPAPTAEPARLIAASATPLSLAAREPAQAPPPTPIASQLGPVPRSANPPSAMPSHVIGIGGRMATPAAGVGASGRVWAADPLGIQFELGRSTHTAAAVTGGLRTTIVGSSVVYSLADVVRDALWVRPYVGGGASFYRSSLNLIPSVAGAPEKGVGYQVFGGGEFTWAGLPQLGVSADLRRVWAPSLFPESERGGLGLGLSAHWYVK